MFKKLDSKTIHQNTWVTVLADQISFPNGSNGEYVYVKRSDGAGIVVLNSKQEILLLKQYRYPINAFEWNLPGGAIDSDQPDQAAIRELEEETGLVISSVKKIGEFYPLSSCSTEKSHIFLAETTSTELPASDVSDANEEVVEKKFIPLTVALNMIDRGEITDATTCNIIQIVYRKIQGKSL